MVDFLVIGPFSAATYKEVFFLIKDGDVSIGYNRVGEFSDGTRFGNTIWFTSMKDDYPLEYVLSRKYDEGDYKKFDNYDAINIDRSEDIPVDYYGVMAVPVTFLEKLNPGQFEIVGVLIPGSVVDDNGWRGSNGICMTKIENMITYRRLLIRRK